jgi:hypothetical protein
MISMPRPLGMTQIGELLLVDVAQVKQVAAGTPLHAALVALVEEKVASVVENTFVIDCLEAARVVGAAGVQAILDRANWGTHGEP